MSAGAHTSGEFLDADGDTADGDTADSSPNSFGQSYVAVSPGAWCGARPALRRLATLTPGYPVVYRFSYHFKFAVDVPMHAMSSRPSPFKSLTAHPAPAIPPSSRTLFTQALPSKR